MKYVPRKISAVEGGSRPTETGNRYDAGRSFEILLCRHAGTVKLSERCLGLLGLLVFWPCARNVPRRGYSAFLFVLSASPLWHAPWPMRAYITSNHVDSSLFPPETLPQFALHHNYVVRRGRLDGLDVKNRRGIGRQIQWLAMGWCRGEERTHR